MGRNKKKMISIKSQYNTIPPEAKKVMDTVESHVPLQGARPPVLTASILDGILERKTSTIMAPFVYRSVLTYTIRSRVYEVWGILWHNANI